MYTTENCVFNACGISGWVNQIIKKGLDEQYWDYKLFRTSQIIIKVYKTSQAP